MNRLTRSKLANAKKTEYIIEGKKKQVARKLGSRVRQSKLNNMLPPPQNDQPPINEEDFLLDISDSENSESTDYTDVEEVTKKRAPRRTTKNNKDSELLQLQREIEMLRLQQIKQSKKANRVRKEVIEASNTKKKPQNPDTVSQCDTIKKRIFCEF